MKSEIEPHERRHGWLRNGNRVGDFTKAPRCGARTRRGTQCQCPAMANGRCRLHGGLSTGPKTAAGIERIRLARTKHGRNSMRAMDVRRAVAELMKDAQALLDRIRNESPGSRQSDSNTLDQKGELNEHWSFRSGVDETDRP